MQALIYAFFWAQSAAILLRDAFEATERDIRRFAATRLAEFKVPPRVLIVDEIPEGPTGKMQRVGLAERLGLASATNTEAGSQG